MFEHAVVGGLGAVALRGPGVLEQIGDSLRIGPGFNEAAYKALSAVHQVLLSTDADVHFYLLLVSDPEIPHAYLTLVRYFEDIRKLDVKIIGVSEMMSRTVVELNVVGAEPLTLDTYPPRGIQLSEFLTWQLTRRIQQELMTALEGTGVAVGRGQGQFQEGEFLFALNIVPMSHGPIDEETMQRAFETTTQLIAEVLSGYEFESFKTIHLVHPLTGRHLIIPRPKLEFFR